jgi:nicotinamidase-related amidase
VPRPFPAAAETALLVVECQNGVVGPTSMLPELAALAAPALATIGRLAAAAREAGVQVVHLTFVPHPGKASLNAKTPLLRATGSATQGWSPNEFQVVDGIGVGPDDLVLPRASGINPIYGTETLRVLRNMGITHLVLAGVSTNIALPAVLSISCDEGFDCTVPTDAVVGAPAAYSAATIEHSLAMMARLTTVDDLISAWKG